MTVSLKVTTKLAPDQIVRRMHELAQREVLVGLPGSAGGEGGLTFAELGYLHEYGSPANNIPARPFLKRGVESVQPAIVEGFRRVAERVVEGDARPNDALLGQVGEIAVQGIGAFMAGPNFAPNKPSTIRRKGSAQPLIDSGSMKQALKHVVVSKSEAHETQVRFAEGVVDRGIAGIVKSTYGAKKP